LELLDAEGFAGSFDFVYLPVDLKRWAGLGYAFVNFAHHADAKRASAHFQGFRNWVVNSSKVCVAMWSEPLQGLAPHIERYRNSPLMHELVPEHVRPVLLHNGTRVPFPAPTREIKYPQPRNSKASR